MTRLALWTALFAIALSTTACQPAPPPEQLFREDFETLCDGLPCGWVRAVGMPWQARVVETIHPGEHGRLLDGPDVIVRGPGGEPMEVAIESGRLQTRLVASCDEVASLTISGPMPSPGRIRMFLLIAQHPSSTRWLM